MDCFSENRFCGNPAGVCVMPEWLPDTILQAMASEHHLPAQQLTVREVTAQRKYVTR